MLVIRKEQIAVFEEAAQKMFESELVDHLKVFIPKHSESAGDEQLKETVCLGVERAKEYGFTSRGTVRFYVEMMCLFGCDFDSDPQYAVAKSVLDDKEITDQTQRADTLFDKMAEYDEKVSGPKQEFYVKALERLNSVRIEHYDLSPGSFDNEVVGALRKIYPQKCEFLGKEVIRELISISKKQAGEMSITSDRGLGLVVALIFVVGRGFAHDPMYPWISKALNDEKRDPNERIENAHTKMKIYLDALLNRRSKR